MMMMRRRRKLKNDNHKEDTYFKYKISIIAEKTLLKSHFQPRSKIKKKLFSSPNQRVYRLK